MAKGSYKIKASGESKPGKGGNSNNEAELENQECMNSCLSPVFLRSLSFHDRPRSSLPSNKEFRCNRYQALVSSSLEKIPSNLLLPSERKSQASTFRRSGSVGVGSKAKATIQSPIFNATQSVTDQGQLSVADNWLCDRNTRLYVESEKLLEKTMAILSAIDKDISESFTTLIKPESIALESVIEIYKNKSKSATGCSAISEFNLSAGTSSPAANKNKQPPLPQRPMDVQTHSPSRRQKDFRQNLKNLQSVPARRNPDSFEENSLQESPKKIQVQHPQESPKNIQVQSLRESLKNIQVQSLRESLKNIQVQSLRESPKNIQVQSSQESPKSLKVQSSRESPNSLQVQSSRESPNSLQVQPPQESSKEIHNFPQFPKNVPAHSSQQSSKNPQSECDQQSPKTSRAIATPHCPKNVLIHSAQQTLTNLQSLISNSENTQSLIKPDSDNLRSVESPENVLSSSKRIVPEDVTKAKFPIEFDLPSDHEQFVKVIGALQIRCLEYREMIQDIAISALEECRCFSELSVRRIRYLRKQFESQKRNFRDFKDLCCKSVVFGPDSQPIDEKVTEVIQSFYLKLLQEENETLMAHLEFGLKMGEIYAKMLKYETESKKIITTLEKEVLYLKKTSIGFKV